MNEGGDEVEKVSAIDQVLPARNGGTAGTQGFQTSSVSFDQYSYTNLIKAGETQPPETVTTTPRGFRRSGDRCPK